MSLKIYSTIVYIQTGRRVISSLKPYFRWWRIRGLIITLVTASLLIHSYIYAYQVTIISNGGVIRCDIIYTPQPSGNYTVSGVCTLPSGKYFRLSQRPSIKNVVQGAVKPGHKEGDTSLRSSGVVWRVKYELVGKYGVTLLSELGIHIVLVITLAIIAGAAYTLLNWRKYVIH